MSLKHFFATTLTTSLLSVAGLGTSLHAETEIIEVPATTSALLWSNYTIWDCCDVGSIAINPTSMNVHTCGTMGGYCSSGKDIAMWLFELPDLPEGAVILHTTLTGRITSGGGSGILRMSGTNAQSISVTSGMNTFNNPNTSQNVYWPSGNFTQILNLDENDSTWAYDYVMVAGYRSTSMTFSNSGSDAAKMLFLVDIPDACEADMNADGYVNVTDMLQLIESWGSCNPGPNSCNADLDGDSYVNISDLLILIDSWGSCE